MVKTVYGLLLLLANIPVGIYLKIMNNIMTLLSKVNIIVNISLL